MASVTLSSVADRFPVGTLVAAYPVSAWRPGSAPIGSVVSSGSVASDGSVAFSGLDEAAGYVAYALVSSEHRYVAFRSQGPSDAPGATPVYTPENVSLLVELSSEDRALLAAIQPIAIDGGDPAGRIDGGTP